MGFALSSQTDVQLIRDPRTNDYISVDALIRDIMFFALEPKVSSQMQRKRKKLPITIRLQVHPIVHQIVFSTFDKVILETDDKIKQVFGGEIRKSFDRGSYSIVKAPMTVWYENGKGKTVVIFRYAVYNQDGILQWPIAYEAPIKSSKKTK